MQKKKSEEGRRKDSLGYGESNANKIFIKTLIITNTDMVPHYKIKKKIIPLKKASQAGRL